MYVSNNLGCLRQPICLLDGADNMILEGLQADELENDFLKKFFADIVYTKPGAVSSISKISSFDITFSSIMEALQMSSNPSTGRDGIPTFCCTS